MDRVLAAAEGDEPAGRGSLESCPDTGARFSARCRTYPAIALARRRRVQSFGSTAEPSFLKDREPDNALGYVEPNAIGMRPRTNYCFAHKQHRTAWAARNRVGVLEHLVVRSDLPRCHAPPATSASSPALSETISRSTGLRTSSRTRRTAAGPAGTPGTRFRNEPAWLVG